MQTSKWSVKEDDSSRSTYYYNKGLWLGLWLGLGLGLTFSVITLLEVYTGLRWLGFDGKG